MEYVLPTLFMLGIVILIIQQTYYCYVDRRVAKAMIHVNAYGVMPEWWSKKNYVNRQYQKCRKYFNRAEKYIDSFDILRTKKMFKIINDWLEQPCKTETSPAPKNHHDIDNSGFSFGYRPRSEETLTKVSMEGDNIAFNVIERSAGFDGIPLKRVQFNIDSISNIDLDEVYMYRINNIDGFRQSPQQKIIITFKSGRIFNGTLSGSDNTDIIKLWKSNK